MKKNRKGFTLIELVVVTVIIGILATMGIPYYLKTIEVSKAGDGVGIGQLLGNSYRMYLVDNPGASLNGQITNTCNTYTACALAPLAPNPCLLVACNYVAKQNWDGGAYTYSIGAGGFASSIRRRTGSSPGTNTTPYSGWGYDFSTSGGCSPVGGAPSCPNF